MGRSLGALCALLLVTLTASTSALAASRIALVIGNSAYTSAPLKNPVNDAALMARTLAGLGFDVIHENDLDLRGMKRAVRTLTERIAAAGEGAVGLFYYSGHGVEIGGTNYFVPVDATIATAADIPIEMLSANDVMAAIDAAPNSFNIIIFDACRNDPFRALFRSQSRGLAKMDAPQGSILAYSTSPGNVAEDGVGDNSTYTASLAAAMQEPGVQVEAMFKKVRIAVKEATGGKQLPWETTSLLGDFTFTDPLPAASSDPQPVPTTPDADWALVKDTNSVKVLKGFLQKYAQDPIFGPLAEERIALLTTPAPAPSAGNADSGSGECPGAGSLLVSVADQRDCLKPGDVFRDIDGGPEMVVIPAGNFMMGSPEEEEGRENSEGPRHEVSIEEPLAVGKFEVTLAQFRQFPEASLYGSLGCSVTGSFSGWGFLWGKSWSDTGFEQTDQHPAACISRDAAKAYVKWLAKMTRRGYRLLSEAEWEYAARGQTEPGGYSRFSFGNSATDLCGYANGPDRVAKASFSDWADGNFADCDDGHAFTSPVGSFKPNAFGLYDMHGNVWEWVDDCWHDTYEHAPTDGSVWETGCFPDRFVLRGGSWYRHPEDLRSARRFLDQAGSAVSIYGFRVARTLAP